MENEREKKINLIKLRGRCCDPCGEERAGRPRTTVVRPVFYNIYCEGCWNKSWESENDDKEISVINHVSLRRNDGACERFSKAETHMRK